MSTYQNPSKAFVWSLIGVTIFPPVFFCFLFSEGSHVAVTGKDLLALVGASHVPATLAFYFDSNFRTLSYRQPIRYIVAPIALIVATMAAFAIFRSAQGFLVSGYWIWQTWHYGRQNLGVNSFISASNGTSTNLYERRLINLGVFCGILGILQVLAKGSLPTEYLPLVLLAWKVGAVGTALAAILLTAYLIKRRARSVSLNLGLILSVLFFVPMFLTSTIEAAFLSYAIAHANQYFIFMLIAAWNAPQSDTFNRKAQAALGLLAIAFLLGAGTLKAITLSDVSLLGDLAMGAVLGLTMAHFTVDAGIWKLSNPASREFVMKRFGFIFQRLRTSPSA